MHSDDEEEPTGGGAGAGDTSGEAEAEDGGDAADAGGLQWLRRFRVST